MSASMTVITGKKVTVHLLSGGHQGGINTKGFVIGNVTMQTEKDFTIEDGQNKKILIPWTAVQCIELP